MFLTSDPGNYWYKQLLFLIVVLPAITGHKCQLQQLFQNLIGNALTYTKPGIPLQMRILSTLVLGYETELSLNGDETYKQYHQIVVQDNGIGFEQKDAERIFNVFTRMPGNSE